jgi:hypothetical protein
MTPQSYDAFFPVDRTFLDINLPLYYDNDARNTTIFLGPICYILYIIYKHEEWDPHSDV